jgi:hypothetical protein
MKDLLTQDGRAASDLSKRMADNVVQTLVAYMQAPGSATAEAVHAYSTALSSLSLLAIAEQLQALAVALEPDGGDVEESITDQDDENAGSWTEYKWRYGSTGVVGTEAV